MTFIVTEDWVEHYPNVPEDAPRDCVQVIVQTVPDGYGGMRRDVVLNFGYYYFRNGRWRGTTDPFEALYHHSCGCALCHSSLMDDDDWVRLRDKYIMGD